MAVLARGTTPGPPERGAPAPHGPPNALRALVKHLEGVSDDASSALTVPNAAPLCYDVTVPPSGHPVPPHVRPAPSGPAPPMSR